MKILVISNLYPPIFLGGYELSCRDVADNLRLRGHDITILASNYGVRKPVKEHNIIRNLEHFYGNYPETDLGMTYIQAVRSKWLSYRNYKEVKKCIRADRPDMVYYWSLDRVSPLSVMWAAKQEGVPGVVHLMDEWLYQARIKNIGNSGAVVRFIKNYAREKVDGVLFNIPLILMSKTLREDYLENGFPEKNMHLVYSALPLPLPALEHPPEPDGTLKFLYVGQLGYWKGTHVVLEAMKLLKKNTNIKVKLDIIGDGFQEYVRQLQHFAATNLMAQDVRILGKKQREDIFTAMKNYDAMIFPTLRKEPFGFVAIEGMMAGLPVIASDKGGPAEIIDDMETGILFIQGDAVDLSKKMHYFASNPDIRLQIRKNAYNMVKQKYDFNNHVNKIEEILLRYAGEKI